MNYSAVIKRLYSQPSSVCVRKINFHIGVLCIKSTPENQFVDIYCRNYCLKMKKKEGNAFSSTHFPIVFFFYGLTALLLVENANLASVLAGLEAKLALVAVAYTVVTADRLELAGALGTLADCRVVIVLDAHSTPLTDL